MDPNVDKQIRAYLREYFYYVAYPGKSPEGFWRDASGKTESIMAMSPEELRERIRRIDTDLYRFEGVVLGEVEEQALGVIFPIAQELRNKLAEELAFQEAEEEKARKRHLVEFKEALELARRPKPPSDPRKRRSITVELPGWMVDRLAREGEIGASVEKYLRAAGLGETDAGPAASSAPVDPPPRKAAPAGSLAPVLVNSLEAILKFTRLALSYDFPKETLFNYLRLIDRSAKRMKDHLEGSPESTAGKRRR